MLEMAAPISYTYTYSTLQLLQCHIIQSPYSNVGIVWLSPNRFFSINLFVVSSRNFKFYRFFISSEKLVNYCLHRFVHLTAHSSNQIKTISESSTRLGKELVISQIKVFTLLAILIFPFVLWCKVTKKTRIAAHSLRKNELQLQRIRMMKINIHPPQQIALIFIPTHQTVQVTTQHVLQKEDKTDQFEHFDIFHNTDALDIKQKYLKGIISYTLPRLIFITWVLRYLGTGRLRIQGLWGNQI